MTGLDGALQRIIVNGNAIEDLVEVAKDSRGISRYVGPPCDDNDKDLLHRRPKAKCMNGGICTPFFRSYVCKCKVDFIGPKCEKSKSHLFKKREITTLKKSLFLDVNAVSEKSAVKLDGKTFLKFTNKMNKM